MRSWGFVLLCWRNELEGSRRVCYDCHDSLTSNSTLHLTLQLIAHIHYLAKYVTIEGFCTEHQLRLTQVTLSIDPELVVRLCASERQEIQLDLAEPDAVDRIRTPIATTAHAHNQSITA